MQPIYLLLVVAGYFVLLMVISLITGRNASDDTYFKGNKSSPWYLVAFGMIGASLSGVTFISLPGSVGAGHFSYMQMVIGYLLGYLVIAFVLMPIYYRMNLTSIYGYLEKRFGFWSYKTGAFFFLLSRVIGASFRLYLAAMVLQLVFERVGLDKMPFGVTVAISIALIYLYTFRGGIKTVVWTDTLQTLFMLLAAGLTIWWISDTMDLSLGGMVEKVQASKYSQVIVWDWKAGNAWWKHLLAGAFTAIVMTGLDQDMMQKNLTCKTLKAAQTNMVSFSVVLIFVNLGFLALGALLFLYGSSNGIVTEGIINDEYTISMIAGGEAVATPIKPDKLYPLLSLDYFPAGIAILFILGLVAAAYSSADSALAALTTSFCVDFLNFEKQSDSSKHKFIRYLVQAGFSFLIFIVILVFNLFDKDGTVINSIFKAAGFTYGPLLGLYAFGIFTKWDVRDQFVPFVCVGASVTSYLLNWLVPLWTSYKFGFEILLVNGLLTFLGLVILIKPRKD